MCRSRRWPSQAVPPASDVGSATPTASDPSAPTIRIAASRPIAMTASRCAITALVALARDTGTSRLVAVITHIPATSSRAHPGAVRAVRTSRRSAEVSLLAGMSGGPS